MRAIDLSPGFALGHLVLGMATLYSGRAEEAKACLQHGLRLNWSDPHNFAWLSLLAVAHLLTGCTEEALEAATEALHLRPDWQVTLETMAVCCAAANRIEEARRYVDAMHKDSAYPSDLLRPLKAHNPDWQSNMQKLIQETRG
jgi:pentatricopeptide repeat protein